MEKDIEYTLGSSTVIVKVSVHDNFVNCLVDEPSPFKHSVTLGIGDISKVNTVVIKCFMPEDERHKVRNKIPNISAQNIFHKILPGFRQEMWPGAELREVETHFCNHFEEQYKYIFVE